MDDDNELSDLPDLPADTVDVEQRLHELTLRDRVRAHTAPIVNRRIDAMTAGAIVRAERSGHDGMVRRLEQLDREWDVDRALMANFAIVGGVTYALSQLHKSGSRGWAWFFRAQLGFLLLHAVVGWCPPASLFRRLGFRTTREIEAERERLTTTLRARVV